jgi:hypothetical protein
MAKRTFSQINWTPTATADNTALANATYMALKGGSGTQLINVNEIYIAGMASASAITATSLARSMTIALTPTALATPASDGPNHPSTAALAAPPVTFTAAATGGSRSNTTVDAHLMLGLNAFGGIVRYNASPGQEFSILGNTANLGEAYLSGENIAGAGLVTAHLMYEPFAWFSVTILGCLMLAETIGRSVGLV